MHNRLTDDCCGLLTSPRATQTTKKATILRMCSSRTLQINTWIWVSVSENFLNRTISLFITKPHLLGIISVQQRERERDIIIDMPHIHKLLPSTVFFSTIVSSLWALEKHYTNPAQHHQCSPSSSDSSSLRSVTRSSSSNTAPSSQRRTTGLCLFLFLWDQNSVII